MRLDDAGLPARVLVVEPTGSEAQMVVDVGDPNLTCLFRHRIDARPGEAIAIVPEAGVTHLFDPESGRRLN